jgi:26S proteasome regulatory subunit N2
MSNLPEHGKASTSKSGRKTEPSFEKLQNYSRVTPVQLAYVTFPSESRYQPVRPVSTKPLLRAKGAKNNITTEGFVGVGGILIMIDQRPEDETELISPLEPSVVVSMTTSESTSQETGSRPNIALDESAPEADPPEPFEVREI